VDVNLGSSIVADDGTNSSYMQVGATYGGFNVDGTTYNFYDRQFKLENLGTTTKPSTDSSYVQLYTYSGELYVKDTSGNETQLSPHNFELFEPDPTYEFPWSYYSTNEFIGKKINVDMYGAIKEIERLSGNQFIYTEDTPITDWDEDQERQRLEREEEIAKARDKKHADEKMIPKPYEKQKLPKWMENNKNARKQD